MINALACQGRFKEAEALCGNNGELMLILIISAIKAGRLEVALNFIGRLEDSQKEVRNL